MARVVDLIKRIVLGNRSDTQCDYCGYPLGCGDTAYTHGDHLFCSVNCAKDHIGIAY